MINKIRVILILLIVLNFTKLPAQVDDAALWSHVSIQKNISSFFSLELNQEFRFNENISELGTAFTETGFQYKIIDNIRIGANYRFIQRRRLDNSYSFRHQHAYFLNLRMEVGKFDFILREKIQSRYTDINSSEDGKISENKLRSRLSVRYDLSKRYTPFISAEIYYQLNNPEGNEIDNMRYQAGMDYEINKFHSVSIAYLIDKEINQNNPRTDYVIDIGYEFNF